MSIVLVLEEWLYFWKPHACVKNIAFDFAPRPWTFCFQSGSDMIWRDWDFQLLYGSNCHWWDLAFGVCPLDGDKPPENPLGSPGPSGFDSYQCYRKGHQKGHRKIRKSARFETFWDFRVPFAISWDVVFLHRLAFICPAIADCCVGLGFCDPVGWNWMTCSEHKNQNIPRDSCMWQWNTACRCWLFYVIFRFFIAHILVFFPYND